MYIVQEENPILPGETCKYCGAEKNGLGGSLHGTFGRPSFLIQYYKCGSFESYTGGIGERSKQCISNKK